jgi:glycosyltransferase involved in cell wall biosynthesis
MPRLSIIIPTYQEEHYIERTLKNFADLDISHEIIVVDGGSTDGTLPIIRKYTNMVYVWDRQKIGRRQNIGEARNSGAAMAHGVFCLYRRRHHHPLSDGFFYRALGIF